MASYRISYASDHGWANGEAPSKYGGAPASFDPASAGIDIFRSIGELRTGYAATEIGGATVTDNIQQMLLTEFYNGTTRSREMVGYGSSGRVYRITDEATPAVTLVDTTANGVQGMAELDQYIYFAQKTIISRYGPIDQVSPTFTASYLTGLTGTYKGDTLRHPLHPWKATQASGRALFIGDKNLLKENVAGTGTVVMTLPTDTIITALNDNSSLLLIGAGIDTGEDNDAKNRAWLMTWDGTVEAVSANTSPTEIIPFPEPYISRIEVVEGEIYCFGQRFLYKLVGSSFVIVTKLDCRISIGGSDINRGQLYWKGSDDIRAWGTPDPMLPKARYRPYGSTGTSVTALKWVQDQKLWYADNNNLYELKTGSATGVSWKSRYIGFGQQEEVSEIRLYLSANLASGDDVRVQIINEVGTAVAALTFDFATYGAANSIVLHANQFTNPVAHLTGMQVGILFQAGAVQVREVVVKTKPVAQA